MDLDFVFIAALAIAAIVITSGIASADACTDAQFQISALQTELREMRAGMTYQDAQTQLKLDELKGSQVNGTVLRDDFREQIFNMGESTKDAIKTATSPMLLSLSTLFGAIVGGACVFLALRWDV